MTDDPPQVAILK